MNVNVSAYVAAKIARRKEDFRVDHFTAGVKAGGSGKDTSNTAVRITDKITGLSAECQEQRSQRQNKAVAFERLAQRLIAHYKAEEKRVRAARAEKSCREQPHIRTYNEKSGVRDERLPGKTFSYSRVLDGEVPRVG